MLDLARCLWPLLLLPSLPSYPLPLRLWHGHDHQWIFACSHDWHLCHAVPPSPCPPPRPRCPASRWASRDFEWRTRRLDLTATLTPLIIDPPLATPNLGMVTSALPRGCLGRVGHSQLARRLTGRWGCHHALGERREDGGSWRMAGRMVRTSWGTGLWKGRQKQEGGAG